MLCTTEHPFQLYDVISPPTETLRTGMRILTDSANAAGPLKASGGGVDGNPTDFRRFY